MRCHRLIARLLAVAGVISMACLVQAGPGRVQEAPPSAGLLDFEDVVHLRRLAMPIVIPTFIPQGFFRNEISAGYDEKTIGTWYFITYAGPGQSFFTVQAASQAAEHGSPKSERRFKYRSPLFGDGLLGESTFAVWDEVKRELQGPLTSGWVNEEHKGYPVYRLNASGMDGAVVVKVFESLRYMRSK